ncbi:hypothetical protein F5Y16DRAFT_271375 [Xylariaceae sp. FL0255]|nr:hypothetical protein F5Y16DRAFT_271375 [Xylariaceae sp. FL0255]
MASSSINLLNGVPTPSPIPADNSNLDPSQSINAATKRKREPSEDDGKQLNGVNPPAAPDSTDSIPTIKLSPDALRDYYTLLKRFDSTPSILKRPLVDVGHDPTDEPEPKRQKSVDHKPSSIADKVAQGQYHDVNTIVADLQSALADTTAELRRVVKGEGLADSDSAIASVLAFKKKAHDLFFRELSYARPAEAHKILQAFGTIDDLQSNADGKIILSVFGEAPKSRQLFSSLQKPTDGSSESSSTLRPLREIGLPNGVKVAKAIPYTLPTALDQDKKAKTLGELFPAPRNLPSLAPPKAPKSTTKGVHVGWHRPELTEKSKYRAGSYFSQQLSTGRWLDYSNASPSSQSMTKQRERALSLAGNKPSSSEIESTELESLFRGAFSSFAPSKDDSAAMVSSGLIGHTMWWQKVGQRSFDRLVEAEYQGPSEEKDQPKVDQAEEVDEELIQQAIDNWDDSAIDPSLEEVCCPTKSDAEKDTDDILQDVSDMIQTLISYQRNRNLTLPSAATQSRYAADPAQSDMLTNGTPVQPGDEEMATYETLKAQLALVVKTLPPYAVARLNSDKLEELNISMKLEVRTEEYQGLMEDSDAAIRARGAQNPVPAPNPRPVSHRSNSSNTMQFGQPYQHNAHRPSLPTPPFYQNQTPSRAPQAVRAPQTMPQAYGQRAASNTGYRPPSGYANTGYAQQYSKPVPQYNQQPAFTTTPTPSRPVYTPSSKHVPGYHNMGRLGNATPQPRYQQQSYQTPHTQPPHYTTHQSYQTHQQPAATPTHGAYGGYTNGTSAMPQRAAAASPHNMQQQPHSPHMSQQSYHSATPPRQPSFNGQPPMANNQQRPYYATGNAPNAAMHNGQMPNQHYTPNQHNQNPGTSSFQTSLSTHQVQQASE